MEMALKTFDLYLLLIRRNRQSIFCPLYYFKLKITYFLSVKSSLK